MDNFDGNKGIRNVVNYNGILDVNYDDYYEKSKV